MFLFATVLALIAPGSLAVEPQQINRRTWTDWEAWEASPEIAKFYPYYPSCYDEDGRVVYVVEYGKCNPREFIKLSEEKVQEALKYYEQYVRRVERNGSSNSDQGVVLLADWDGFGLDHYASTPALKAALKMFAPLVRISPAVKYGFFINAGGLRKLKFGFQLSPAEAQVDMDQVLLSKLTGILAFKKMATKGVKIKFVCRDAQAALRLNHLSSFVSLVSKF